MSNDRSEKTIAKIKHKTNTGKWGYLGKLVEGKFGPRLKLSVVDDDGVWYNATSITYTNKEGQTVEVSTAEYPYAVYLEDGAICEVV